jgi:hypothetical protein
MVIEPRPGRREFQFACDERRQIGQIGRHQSLQQMSQADGIEFCGGKSLQAFVLDPSVLTFSARLAEAAFGRR